MRRKNPYVASPEQVRISRDGETAIIEYAEDDVWTTHLKIGPKLLEMSDADVLAFWNAHVRTIEEFKREHMHVAVEIPPGRPQIKRFEEGNQWVPRGHVIRCTVDDDADEIVKIQIDDHELSLEEFGKMLRTWAGWGLRIVAVPADELADGPVIDVREPEEKSVP